MNNENRYKLEDVALKCNLDTNNILQFISYSWIIPVDSENYLFDEEDIARILLICDLQDQLGVNEEAVPVILHLIDQLNYLHRSHR
jgi:chaperone modulatory protein CbpM